MIATADSWKREPFTAGTRIPFDARFTTAEFARLEAGLIPEVMEDKWFVYFQAPHLFLHRSWTGEPVYRVELEREADGASVVEALWADDGLAVDEAERVYQARLLEFLIANLLLGQRKPFPLRENAEESMAGILQHHVAGTAFPEVVGPKKKT